ncbi:MAG: PSD1 domain-containing protein [Planctomycetales bacterium]|nr:PSD1 domain-containing protein [Planctomycetales bacterium]
MLSQASKHDIRILAPSFKLCWLGFVGLAVAGNVTWAADQRQREFFENRIRPVLVDQCYECHNSHGRRDGGLSLDHREAALQGGERGPAVVPGNPAGSLLLGAIRHANEDLRMPDGNAKLSEQTISDFVHWIESGAFDPRHEPPSAKTISDLTSWPSVRERRMRWWSLQPIAESVAPRASDDLAHPIDRFLAERLIQDGLSLAPPADRSVLLRRLSFALTGLPPTLEELTAFETDSSHDSVQKQIDRLLRSPHYGERWARHWMDWFRYAESHGSEGDPEIPNAWMYRDYLIRALNDDVPYDQLVREHLAGDLLAAPRINEALGINESALGLGHFRMVQHGYAPTDALDEQVRFTDNQIDVVTKAFLGQTVSCARCHDHKFDPISQSDFYALYGVFASCRPALLTVTSPAQQRLHRESMIELKDQIRRRLAAAWLVEIDSLASRLQRPEQQDHGALEAATGDPLHPLHAWANYRKQEPPANVAAWKSAHAAWQDVCRARDSFAAAGDVIHFRLTSDDYSRWPRHGMGLTDQPGRAGQFHVAEAGDTAIGGIYPAGVYTHGLTTKDNGYLTSPRFRIETDEVSVLAAGRNSRARLVIQNYPRIEGPIYGAKPINQPIPTWITFDTRYWKGDWAYVEIATNGDLPIGPSAPETRSWFGAVELVAHNRDATRPRNLPGQHGAVPLAAFVDGEPPTTPAELVTLYQRVLHEAVIAWRDDKLSDDQSRFLNYFVQQGLLSNSLASLGNLAPLVETYRRLEAELPVPTRAPGIIEGDVFNQPLFARGNHKHPADPVPRRFLESLDATPFPEKQSGRLELADAILAPENPLTSRVIVNRVWHHLFGRGIVATPDGFGRLGAEPSHPKLLDWLARRFVAERWSLKSLIRKIVSTRAFQQSHLAAETALAKDPNK